MVTAVTLPFGVLATPQAALAQVMLNPTYPATRRETQTDDVAGVHISDPYRWLEDVGSPEVHAWAAAQTTVTRSFLEQLPRRNEIAGIASRVWSSPSWDMPSFGGERVFFTHSDGRANQPVVDVQDRRDMPVRTLIDPNAFSEEGLIAVVDQTPSPDGRYLAYAISTQGSSWRTIHIRDLRTNQDLADELPGIWNAHIAWTDDDRGFVYTRSDVGRPTGNPLAPQGRQQLVYHRVGQPRSSDRIVFERPDHPEWRLRADVSDDGQYFVVAARSLSAEPNRMYLIDLANPGHPNFGAPLVTLFDAGDAAYDFVANDGPVFFVRTTKSAPRGRVIAVDINAPGEDHWTTVVRESNDPIVSVLRVDDRLVVQRVRDAHSALDLFTLDGVARGTIPLPGVGTVTRLAAHGRTLFYEYSSVLQSRAVYQYDLDARVLGAYHAPQPDTTLAEYETTPLFFTSGDGTRVPMFVTARRGITLDGSHATLLSAFGAFGDAATPSFSPLVVAWLQMGGIFATANVRGGGEYGRAWHDAAMTVHKRVSIDDLIAAAEFLVNQRYTRPSMLGAFGEGVGGLLAGAAITRRPDLFAAAAIDGGLFDMSRFDRFAAARDWTPEFGSPGDSTELRAMLDYSPLAAVHIGASYPPVLLTAGARDDYLTPANSYKFVAALQAARSGAVALLRVDDDLGHGPGAPRGRSASLDADRLTFLAATLHVAR